MVYLQVFLIVCSWLLPSKYMLVVSVSCKVNKTFQYVLSAFLPNCSQTAASALFGRATVTIGSPRSVLTNAYKMKILCKMAIFTAFYIIFAEQ